MKKNIFKISIILAMITFGYIGLKGQNLSSNPNDESISLFTDRTLYIAGEQVQFVAELSFSDNVNNMSLSKINSIEDINELLKTFKKPKLSLSNIVYVELIAPNGEKIVGAKYLVENSCSNGCFNIPKDILTGVYYIRAYTKFMRNSGPSIYSYIPLKIVNPFKQDVTTYNHNHMNNLSSRDSTTKKDSLNDKCNFTISVDRDKYSTRDQVKVQIKGENLKQNSLKGLNLTIVPEESIRDIKRVQPITDKPLIKQYYYPETDGLSITGKLNDSKSEKPLTNTTVNLSILGNCKDFIAVQTDSTGRFFFRMPNFKGVRDVFLCTETLIDSKSSILIDNDLCQSKVEIPSPSFELSNLEGKVAYNMALNVQISSHFNKVILKDTIKLQEKAFYGEPQLKLVLDKYIQLPTIEDYISELIPMLYIKKHKGKKYFKIYSEEAEMVIYKPLVLLDLVAIDNPEKILSLPPQSISHIDLINSPYIKGNNIYGGIISFFSKKGDFAGIDLPSSGIFLDFNFLADCPNSCCEKALTQNQPDIRNTLLWLPRITLDSSNSKELSFTTADTPGKYIMVLRGVLSNGKTFTCKKSFTVYSKI